MNYKLRHHETAQALSRSEKEASGARTLSFSTKEVVDYLQLTRNASTGLYDPIAVEIKTGKGSLSAFQKAWCADPPILTVVEYWQYRDKQWTIRKVKWFAPKT